MEKAKKEVQELEDRLHMASESDISLLDDLKPDLNNLLQMYLPGWVTIEQCEILGTVIYNMIQYPENYLKHAKSNG